jgi:hypothetical protein
MILTVKANLKEIDKQGKDYSWPRPKVCGRCYGDRLWGHGFVETIFSGYRNALLIHRYRCPECGCIIKLRPEGYYSRFQSPKETIRSQIFTRLGTGRWPSGSVKDVCRHWLRGLKRNTLAHLGMDWMSRLTEAFDRLIEMGTIPVSRGI